MNKKLFINCVHLSLCLNTPVSEWYEIEVSGIKNGLYQITFKCDLNKGILSNFKNQDLGRMITFRPDIDIYYDDVMVSMEGAIPFYHQVQDFNFPVEYELFKVILDFRVPIVSTQDFDCNKLIDSEGNKLDKIKIKAFIG